MRKFWIYGYAHQVEAISAASARAAAQKAGFAVAMVRDGHGRTLTPDLWAS